MSMNHISSVSRKFMGQCWPKEFILPTVLIIPCAPLLTQKTLVCCNPDFLGDPLLLNSVVIKLFLYISLFLRKNQDFSGWQIILNKWATSAPLALHSYAQTETTMGISGGMKDEIQTRNHVSITPLLNFHLCSLSDFPGIFHKITHTYYIKGT